MAIDRHAKFCEEKNSWSTNKYLRDCWSDAKANDYRGQILAIDVPSFYMCGKLTATLNEDKGESSSMPSVCAERK